MPAAWGIRKRHRAAQDRHPFKKFFYPVDPHNAAEVSMFMSLYSEHKPKHLKGFQCMAAHWNAIKWAQRSNAVYLAVAYKDGVQLRNFHRVLSAEIGRIESLKLAGLLQDPQPSSLLHLQTLLSPKLHLQTPPHQQPSLPLDRVVLGCEVSLEAGSGSQLHEPVQSGPECSGPSTSARLPSTLLQKRSAAKQSALPFHATQQQKSPNPKAAKKPETSTAAADHGQQTNGQKCKACFAYNWYQATLALPGDAFADMSSITPLYIRGNPGHRSHCPHREAFDTVMGVKRAKGNHASFPGWGPQHQKHFSENENGLGGKRH